MNAGLISIIKLTSHNKTSSRLYWTFVSSKWGQYPVEKVAAPIKCHFNTCFRANICHPYELVI